MPDFIPGLELSAAFYQDVVRPLLDEAFPGLRHSATRLDSGSDVLGYDDAMSTDHDWGPRLQLLLHEADYDDHAEGVRALLAARLPRTFRGWHVSFVPPDPEGDGSWLPDPSAPDARHHRVEVTTLRAFLRAYLGMDVLCGLTPVDWLVLPAQKLRTFAVGGVFYDGAAIAPVQERLAWYPHDVWLLLMAAGWQRIGQEEHLMSRAGYAGDELGSALIGARLVRDVMRLAFLMERQYAPYPKWFGRAFQALEVAPELLPALEGALQARDWQTREAQLMLACEKLAARHNALGLTDPLPETARPFHNRPFRVIEGESFAAALLGEITDPAVRRVAALPLVGGVDQFSDSTDLLADPRWPHRLRRMLLPPG